ncbi:octanoyltransferase [Salipaludibacillus neizhouensis]|uniref:Octanoyl-[GcvH]:protein N-octanoyltransferase n=1 Tax=Salipaludibacillus neizhouensis TaxID=885475 RepID=A0A3A9KBP6_9BACI|nr:biotin/lipoate A/B protein ligase family protein [Salipaludibacillus neizhouensis]RKL67952.1 octanoyltransferase [Salipaludibacillus neizhouensis]
MENIQPLLTRKNWLVLDQSVSGLAMNPMYSFAMDDTLCRRISEMPETGIARTWVHNKTIVLGIQDSRLPFINEGIAFLKKLGYEVIVRNSGGLAVVLDPEVFNLSLIFKEDRELTIDRGYDLMVAFTRALLHEVADEILDGEIKESYCPGRYDLSIGGRKFAGISQRRLRGGVAVQIYLAVSGSGFDRAALIREFYDRSVQDTTTKFDYPKIEPAKMASLEELSSAQYSIESITHRMLLQLKDLSSHLAMYELDEKGWQLYEENIARMLKRNEKLAED